MTGLWRLASFIVGFIKSHTTYIFKDGKLESSSIKRISINIDKNFTSEITIPQDMKDISMYHFLRKCDGDKEKGPIQVNFEPGPNKALS